MALSANDLIQGAANAPTLFDQEAAAKADEQEARRAVRAMDRLFGEMIKPFGFQTPVPTSKAEFPAAIEKLRDILEYESSTGRLYYRYAGESPGNLATHAGPNGYGLVDPWDIRVSSAAVVWLLHHGKWPPGRVRRKDGDVSNDRIENLYVGAMERPSAVQEGRKPYQRRVPSRGVARCGPDHWQAYVRVNGRQKGLGRFKTEAEAIAARAAWDAGVDLV